MLKYPERDGTGAWLTAPIQLQIDLADFGSVITAVAGADTPPSNFASGVVNFTQVTMQDAGDLIARRFDMSRHALTIPLPESWCQEQLSFPFLSGPQGEFQLSLTGCKAGDLKKLRVWFVQPSDTAANGGIRNPNVFYAPSNIQFAINGLTYMASNSASYLLNDVLRRRTPPTITTSLISYNAVTQQFSTTPVASTWVEIDLAQPHAVGDTGEVALLHGVPVMNSVLNLSGAMPIANNNYTCVVEYCLNCSWMASRGSAEFVF